MLCPGGDSNPRSCISEVSATTTTPSRQGFLMHLSITCGIFKYYNQLVTLIMFEQGCQMVYFQTQNPNLGKFGRVLRWKMLVDFMAILSILRTFGIFMVIWYILWPIGIFIPVLVCFIKKKSGNPVFEQVAA
jgi:hypothetical protein